MNGNIRPGDIVIAIRHKGQACQVDRIIDTNGHGVLIGVYADIDSARSVACREAQGHKVWEIDAQNFRREYRCKMTTPLLDIQHETLGHVRIIHHSGQRIHLLYDGYYSEDRDVACLTWEDLETAIRQTQPERLVPALLEVVRAAKRREERNGKQHEPVDI